MKQALLLDQNVTARFFIPQDVAGTGLTRTALDDHKWTFSPWWDVNLSVPLYCLLVFGLLNFKRDTIFNRFSALGCITTIILFVIVIYKACVWSKNDVADFGKGFPGEIKFEV